MLCVKRSGNLFVGNGVRSKQEYIETASAGAIVQALMQAVTTPSCGISVEGKYSMAALVTPAPTALAAAFRAAFLSVFRVNPARVPNPTRKIFCAGTLPCEVTRATSPIDPRIFLVRTSDENEPQSSQSSSPAMPFSGRTSS